MKKFVVQLYATVRVTSYPIEAETPEKAVEKFDNDVDVAVLTGMLRSGPGLYAPVQDIEYAREVHNAAVDEVIEDPEIGLVEHEFIGWMRPGDRGSWVAENIADNSPFVVFRGVDWARLREQKMWLAGVARAESTPKDQRGMAEGLLGLLDHYMDCAAKELGEHIVFGDD